METITVSFEPFSFLFSDDGITFHPNGIDVQSDQFSKALIRASELYQCGWDIMRIVQDYDFKAVESKEEMEIKIKRVSSWQNWLTPGWIQDAKDYLAYAEKYNPKNQKTKWFAEIILEEHGLSEKREMQKLMTQNGRSGFVYLVKSVFSEHYKIGKTVDTDDRVKMFHVKIPFEIQLEHVVFCGDMHVLERRLHDRYAAQRLPGEWFALTPEHVKEIKQLTETPLDEIAPLPTTIAMFPERPEVPTTEEE